MTLQDQAVSLILENPHYTINDIIDKVHCQKSVAYAAMSAVSKVQEISEPKDYKTVVAISDLHCGHKAGLTPPEWWGNEHQVELRREQKESWNFYTETLSSIGKIDILFVVGDAIDGKGKRSGGTELITTDMNEQIEIATKCINTVNADKVFQVYGTPYHVGQEQDHEAQIAYRVDAKIGSQLWVDVNGIVFNLKHKVGSSSVPYSRATSVSKENLWNKLWSDIEGAPRADVFLRGHVHYFGFTGDPSYLAMTLPPLQAPNTLYGARQCVGTVDFGLTSFQIKPGDTIQTMKWQAHIKRLKGVAPKLLVA